MISGLYFQQLITGQTVGVTDVGIMIRDADITDDTYEPYKPSVEERLAALEAAVFIAQSIETNSTNHDEEETI